jgi:putative oxidoreductase
MAIEATERSGLAMGVAGEGVSGVLESAFHVVLRVGAGLLFMQHGAQKVLGWFGGFGGQPGATAELFSQMGLAGVLELFGGLLVVVGLFVRPVSAVLVLLMLAAYGIAHMPRGGVPVQNGGELALLYALIFAYFAAKGAGSASVDRVIERRAR